MIVKVKTKPNSDREKLEKISEIEYRAELKDPAENNKANIRLIHLLGKEFSVSYRKIRIKNPKSRVKFIEVKK